MFAPFDVVLTLIVSPPQLSRIVLIHRALLDFVFS
jgi:hypothetical protein